MRESGKRTGLCGMDRQSKRLGEGRAHGLAHIKHMHNSCDLLIASAPTKELSLGYSPVPFQGPTKAKLMSVGLSQPELPSGISHTLGLVVCTLHKSQVKTGSGIKETPP